MSFFKKGLLLHAMTALLLTIVIGNLFVSNSYALTNNSITEYNKKINFKLDKVLKGESYSNTKGIVYSGSDKNDSVLYIPNSSELQTTVTGNAGSASIWWSGNEINWKVVSNVSGSISFSGTISVQVLGINGINGWKTYYVSGGGNGRASGYQTYRYMRNTTCIARLNGTMINRKGKARVLDGCLDTKYFY